MIAFLMLSWFVCSCLSIPQVVFSFNSQVPQVAIAGEPYSFSLSPSTFRTDHGSVTYGLSAAPAWLQIDSANGTLFGIPENRNVNTFDFKIIASDANGSTHMPSTLVLATTGGPRLGKGISTALARQGVRTGPTSILYPPKTSFALDLSDGIFVAGLKPVSYYATMNDHTPLPSWVTFDPHTLKLNGVTPQLDNLPQELKLDVIASDVPGFANVRVSFTIVVSNHRFMFTSAEGTYNIAVGGQVNITTLKAQLELDGNHVTDAGITSASAQIPSYLRFDQRSLGLYGTPANGTTTVNATVFVQDRYGDLASILLQLVFGSDSLFHGHIGVLNATAGQPFYYKLARTDFANESLNIQVNLGAASKWLRFHAANLEFSGSIPSSIAAEVIQSNMTITANNNGRREFQQFEIQIVNHNEHAGGFVAPPTGGGMSRKVANIIIGVVAASVFLLGCTVAVFCHYYGRREIGRGQGERKQPVFKRIISRPFAQRTMDTDIWTSGAACDATNDNWSERHFSRIPPRLDVNVSQHQLDRMQTPWVRNSGIWPAYRPPSQRFSSGGGPMLSSRHTYNPHYGHSFTPNHGLDATSMFSPAGYDVYNYPQSIISPSHIFPGYPPSVNSVNSLCSTSYMEPQSHSHSVNTSILNQDGDWLSQHSSPLPSAAMTSPLSYQLPVRNSMYDFPHSLENAKHSKRPVSRRGPYHSSFFAGGASSRRRSSASRFAAHGLGLDTIDGSPDIGTGDTKGKAIDFAQATAGFDAGDMNRSPGQLARTHTQSSTKDWETMPSLSSSSSLGIHRRTGVHRWPSIVSRQSSRYRTRPMSEQIGSVWNRNVVGGRASDNEGLSRSSSIYSWHEPESSSVLDLTQHLSPHDRAAGLQQNPKEQAPIMERTRAAYRLGGKERSQRRQKGAKEKNKAKLISSERGMRPMTVDGTYGIGSLKAERTTISRGNEAFL